MLRSQPGEERQQERFLRTNSGENRASLSDQVSVQHPSQLRGLPRGSKLDQGWVHNLLGMTHQRVPPTSNYCICRATGSQSQSSKVTLPAQALSTSSLSKPQLQGQASYTLITISPQS